MTRRLSKRADHILDLGPLAGEQGGQIVFSGPYEKILADKRSLTGKYLSQRLSIPVPQTRRVAQPGQALSILKAGAHNLKNIDVEIPLGCMVCLTGVSGSGKSTLVEDVLYRGLKKRWGESVGIPGQCQDIVGTEHIADMIFVNQSQIGTTPRANLLTYTRAFDPLRRLLADTELAKLRGYSAGTFSFNVEGGRCETCKGEGFEKVEIAVSVRRLCAVSGVPGAALSRRGLGGPLSGQEPDRHYGYDGQRGADVFCR